MTGLNALPDIDSWLSMHGAEIAELVEFSRCHLDPAMDKLNEIAADINAKSATSGFLLADCESLLVYAKAKAARELTPEIGPTAAKANIEEATRELRRLRDTLRVIVRSLRSMGINCCSIRKAGR